MSLKQDQVMFLTRPKQCAYFVAKPTSICKLKRTKIEGVRQSINSIIVIPSCGHVHIFDKVVQYLLSFF